MEVDGEVHDGNSGNGFWVNVMEFLFIMLGIPMAVAGILSLPVVYFGRRWVQWRPWELLSLLLPFGAWAVSYLILTAHSSQFKSWGNIVEPYLICLSIPLGALVRVLAGKQRETVCAVIVMVLLCLIGALVAVLTPNLGGSLG